MCNLCFLNRGIHIEHQRFDKLQLAEHFINQNNAIDIYQPYFTDPSCQMMQTLIPSFRTVAVMSDPCEPSRPVQHISWSPDQGTLIAVSYADMRFQTADPDCSPDSFVFDLGETTIYTELNAQVRLG